MVESEAAILTVCECNRYGMRISGRESRTGQPWQRGTYAVELEEVHDGAKLVAEMDDYYGKSRIYVNEGSSLASPLVMLYSQVTGNLLLRKHHNVTSEGRQYEACGPFAALRGAVSIRGRSA